MRLRSILAALTGLLFLTACDSGAISYYDGKLLESGSEKLIGDFKTFLQTDAMMLTRIQERNNTQTDKPTEAAKLHGKVQDALKQLDETCGTFLATKADADRRVCAETLNTIDNLRGLIALFIDEQPLEHK